jgi:hypothetical protein
MAVPRNEIIENIFDDNFSDVSTEDSDVSMEDNDDNDDNHVRLSDIPSGYVAFAAANHANEDDVSFTANDDDDFPLPALPDNFGEDNDDNIRLPPQGGKIKTKNNKKLNNKKTLNKRKTNKRKTNKRKTNKRKTNKRKKILRKRKTFKSGYK